MDDKTPKPLENDMERIVQSVNAYDSKCVGCRSHQKDVMLSFVEEGSKHCIHDWFLTQHQAKNLFKNLKEAISRNEEIESGVLLDA